MINLERTKSVFRIDSIMELCPGTGVLTADHLVTEAKVFI